MRRVARLALVHDTIAAQRGPRAKFARTAAIIGRRFDFTDTGAAVTRSDVAVIALFTRTDH